ncbi:MAG: ABC transporter substrate-binding protein [Deltaproteobacteria bacterium]|nr:ABC transporter substrate-binding protein [Deltaproteobacteria bacterium]
MSRHQKNKIILLLAICASSIAYCLSPVACFISFAGEPKPLRVGVVGPETGDDAETGLMTLVGVELAAKVFNDAGGIGGKKIEIIHYDNQSNSQLTQGVVQKLIKEHVIAIITSPTGWSTFGPVWLANASKVILMSAGSKRHIGRSGPFIFRNGLPDEIGTEETIKYAMDKLKYKNYAIITSMRDDETSLQIGGLFRGAIIKKGGKIVSETHVMMGATIEEAISQLKKDAKEPIDAVIFAGDDAAAIDVLNEMRKQGIKAPVIGGDILYTDEFLKNGGELAVGTILYAGFFPDDKLPVVSKFVSEYRRKTGKDPGIVSANAYDSFMLIAEAVKQAKSTDPVIVKESLAKINMQGVTGNITMDAHREAVRQPFLIRVVKRGGGVEFKLLETK